MIRVLQVADKLSVGDATIHGVTRLFSWWIPNFNKSRFKVSFCSLRNRDKAGEYLEGIGGNLFYLNRGKFNPLTLTDLLQLTKKEKINLLHLHGYGATTFGRVCGMLTGIPSIVHEHMYDSNIPPYQRLADCILSRSTNRAIAVSESVKDFLIHYRGLPSNKVDVIYNGVPLNAFSSHNASASSVHDQGWKAELNIPPSHKVVGIVGRLHSIKGHKYYLEAAQQVLTEFTDVTFVVVGDGELMTSLNEQSSSLGVDKSVIFMGYCADVPSLLSEIDIKVIASLSEGVPLTLFEAMAAGCAIVSTNVGGLGEVILDGENGFLVPPKNARALAEKILLLLKDPDLCESIAFRAKETSHRYDVRNTVRQLEKCYEDVLRKC
jgi:glycosyltransferase involved in cell wall biosynthesis